MTFTLDQFRLDGKVAIVTGAGGRGNSIGRAYAFGLANAGAAVVVADLNGEGANAVAEEINASGGKAIGVQVDVSDEAFNPRHGRCGKGGLRRCRYSGQQRRVDGRYQL